MRREPTAGRRKGAATALLSAALLIGGVTSSATARGADFSPVAQYHLCTEDSSDSCNHSYAVNSAVQFRIELAQDEGEEELQHITLKFGPGFRFPKDVQIEDGEGLGTAHIETASGPGCAGAAGTAPVEVDGNFTERDRTQEEVEDGVRVVFRLNLDPIPPIDIKVYGNARKGHHVEASIEDNATTCPPFSFDATFFAKSEGSAVPVLRTPRAAGEYWLRAILTSTEESVVAYRYTYKFSS